MRFVSAVFDELLQAVREPVAARTVLQRLCCDLRAIDRHSWIYEEFARDAGWASQAAALERILSTLWHTGTAESIRSPDIRSIIPQPEAVGGLYAATAEAIGIQVHVASNAARSGSIEDAMAAVEQSYETVYMYEKETAMLNAPDGRFIIDPSSRKSIQEVQRMLIPVRAEMQSRRSDLLDPDVASLTEPSTLASLRVRRDASTAS